jgi:hypothetical protein
MTNTGAQAEKVSSGVTAVALITAIGTALAAFQLFQPKFAIKFAMKRETGHVEGGFWAFYLVPQIIGLCVVIAIICVLLFAFFHQIVSPEVQSSYKLLKSVLDFLELPNLLLVLLAAACLAAIIQMNVLSWIFLGIGATLSIFPIPKLNGAFGSEGRSAGWQQALCICSTWDKGQPLLISQENVERVADIVLLKLATIQRPIDFAERPSGLSEAAMANLAVIGCMIEQAHSVNRWKWPNSWRTFYHALEAIHKDKAIFDPATLVKFQSGLEFSAQVRKLLANQMIAAGEEVPEGEYFAVGSSLAKAGEILRTNGGSILGMLPWYAGLFGSKLFWLTRRLAAFPLLDAKSMRPQTIKLMARWGTIPWAKAAGFLHPFSKDQAWLLLQESVLTVFPEQKDVTFWGVGDVQIAREACRRIFAHVAKSVCQGMTAQAKTVAAKYTTEWDLAAAADFMLWGWASEGVKRGRAEDWKASGGWRWKFSNGRAVKIS